MPFLQNNLNERMRLLGFSTKGQKANKSWPLTCYFLKASISEHLSWLVCVFSYHHLHALSVVTILLKSQDIYAD